ncbi:GNAT family N-acetyltransferase [Pseudohongiella sp.]|uniref:N-acetyltransferase domain-containing protein n=1 Tax=marine sediment metagenome TaxID=412755 RepID=A0A0F9YAH4_9ZZZZ|nr:GNAT family N-acetyltransferase [Pseudohongiella sp.]HDZ08002.1 N-acetyltransferase [Pseudohongiella sp.]HEA64155.1 N-acetyltransferase [Pseudohongiella sp.]
MQISSLKDKPHHLLPLAKWHHAEWSYLNPARTLDERIEEMREDLEGKAIPTTFVAENNDELLGSACILADDMSSHPELSPWLASVYVAEQHRHKGIGSVLVKRVMQHAQASGVKRLYLYTPDQARLYAKLGWQVHSEELYNGTPVTIMSIAFD